ncbi:MAG: DUF5320 family protein [Bryobacteraceae bacterium]
MRDGSGPCGEGRGAGRGRGRCARGNEAGAGYGFGRRRGCRRGKGDPQVREARAQDLERGPDQTRERLRFTRANAGAVPERESETEKN